MKIHVKVMQTNFKYQNTQFKTNVTAQSSNTNIQNPIRKQLLQQELIDLLTRTSKNYLANHNVISKEHKLFLRKKMKT